MATTRNFDTGESFFQREPLTARLKNLIHDYPEGVGILKELIQNADDAGATKIEVIIDWRYHHADNLPDPGMTALLGPALLVYNDAVFTDNDFQSIQNLGVSGKREDLQKTGRFGVGFNSVYHVTDYPNFISRDRIVFFDPNLTAIAHISNQEPGRSWNLAQSQWWDDYPEFMQIYEIGGLQPGTTDFPGTLFRLSLRTLEQAQCSQIRQQPFGVDNIQELLTELENNADELLLFLKSLVEVRVRQVNADSSVEDLITIVTQNAPEVLAQRRQLQSALQGGLEALLEQCHVDQQLPQISYLQTIQTTIQQTQTITQWRVCSLLRVDKDGEIRDTIVQLAEQGQKAIPWAGAAACLSRTSSSEQNASVELAGRAYCFLPLPQITGLPIHVNGFFDLDSSRRELTNDDLTGRDRIRVTWNKLLIRHVLSHAYANLIYSLVKDIGLSAPNRFYEFFPISANGGLEELPQYVLALLHDQPVMRSHLLPMPNEAEDCNSSWIAPMEIHLLPNAWQDLAETLSADLIPIADPPIPQSLQEAFVRANIPLHEYTPANLRGHLKTLSPFVSEISKAPKASLRKREWIIRLLQYCLHDRCRKLHDLPLAILADGQLHRFSNQPHEYPYSADTELRDIFADYPNWFLDADLLEQIPILEQCQGVRQMTPIAFAERLSAVINPQQSDKIKWKPKSRSLPNSNWLAKVYQYLADLHEELPIEQLAEIPLVPGNDQFLHQPRQTSTPLWLDRMSGSDMLPTLAYFGITFVQAEDGLQQSMALFIKRHPETLIWRLTAPDLVEALGDVTTFPKYHSNYYPTLINFLARESSHLDRTHLDRLADFPIYLTNDGQLTDLYQVYLPGGYEPPAIAASVKLLCLGVTSSSQVWKPFFQMLNVPELSRARLILDYLIPQYETLSLDNQRIALTWMRDHLHQAQKSNDDDSQGTVHLKQAIANAALIYCNDGERRPTTKIYLPSSYPIVCKILGDRAFMPDMTFYSEDESLWEHFFTTLEILRTPSADDLLMHIDHLVDVAAIQGVEAVTQTIKEIFEHIIQYWDTLSIATLENHPTTFAEALKSRAWLPPERQSEKLAKFPGYFIPADQLCYPNEIIFRRDAFLIASQKPIFNIASSEISKTTLTSLGFVSVQSTDVINHFKVLIGLEGDAQHQIDARFWQRSLIEIYQYIGETLTSYLNQDWLRQELAGLKCLWDGEKFWRPEHTFQDNIACFGEYRQKINDKELRDVYELLGQKPSPEIEDYLVFLQDLATQFQGESLPDTAAECAIKTLFKLWEQLNETGIDVRSQLLLLTQNNLLLPASQVLIPDAPWRIDGILRSGRAELLHPQLYESCSAIAKYADAPSLARDVSEEYQNFQQNQQVGAQALCQEWRQQIGSQEFQIGLSRLILDEHNLAPEELPELIWLNQTKIFPANEIYTNLYWNGNLIAEAVPGDYYFSESNQTFYIRFDRDDIEVIPGYLAACLNYQLGEAFSLKMHLGILEDLLDIMPARISNILDKKRIVAYLPANQPIQLSETLTSDSDISIFKWNEAQMFDGELAEMPDCQPTVAPESMAISDSSTETEQLIVQPKEAQLISPVHRAKTQPSTMPNSENAWSQAAEPPTSQMPPAEFTSYRHEPRHREILISPDQISTPDKPHSSRATGSFRQRLKSYGPSNNITRRSQIVRRRNAANKLQNSQKPRLLTYVSSQPTEPYADNDQQAIEQAGMARVLAYEQLQGRTARDMNEVRTNHPGYDVVSSDLQGNQRFIEVKAKRGVWDNLGVKMTLMQFNTALEKQDDFWLYVVEQAEDDQKFKIYMIQNPAGRVNEFFYDYGWKALADEQYEI
jgi:hypothetical protein